LAQERNAVGALRRIVGRSPQHLGAVGRFEALRQVQLEMLNKKAAQAQSGEQRDVANLLGVKARTRNYSHPYYWASFIQSGAWSGIENLVLRRGRRIQNVNKSK